MTLGLIGRVLATMRLPEKQIKLLVLQKLLSKMLTQISCAALRIGKKETSQ
jgi:hypothetical protein